MVFYSLKEVVFIYLGGSMLFALLSLIPAFENLDSYTVIIFSTIFVLFLLPSAREKFLRIMIIDRKNIDFRNAILSLAFIIFLCIVFDASEEKILYDFWELIRITIFSPFFEEVVFRGVLLGFFMGLSKNKLFSFFMVSIICAFMHASESFIYSFFMSLAFCFLRISVNSILPGIAVHSLHNIFILIYDGDFSGF